MRKKFSSQASGMKYGWRSGLEEAVAAKLRAAGMAFKFEKVVIPYEQPSKTRKYTPDFLLKNGIIVETKGRFVTADRQKHLLVQAQYPQLDIRFVFSNPNQRISKQSATTYAVWCESKGFLYAKGAVPEKWLREATNKEALALAKSLMPRD